MPVVHVRPELVEVAQPRLLEPPLSKRPVWKVATIVFPNANESASTCVLCWLDEFVYGSLLIGVASTVPAEPLATARRQTAAAPTAIVTAPLLSLRVTSTPSGARNRAGRGRDTPA